MSAGEVRDAIETITKVLSEQPQKGRSKNPLATAALKTGLRFQIIGPNGEAAVTDMPPPLGGKGSAPPPGWLLRASLASCNATVIAMRAAQLGITLKTLKVMSRVHSHLGLGTIYRRSGKLERARDHLIGAATMYREMDMRYWQEQAETEAGEPG
jgi:hypothetical protein